MSRTTRTTSLPTIERTAFAIGDRVTLDARPTVYRVRAIDTTHTPFGTFVIYHLRNWYTNADVAIANGHLRLSRVSS